MDGRFPATLPTTMLAARLAARGGPEQIAIETVPIPELRDGDVLVKVEAAAITPSELDWEPTWQNADGSPRTPTTPSHEVAGTVFESTQAGMLAVASAVFGLSDFYRDGAAAEYIAVRARDLALRPASLDAVRASALPISALTAWQALFDHGHLLAGQTVLVHGAAGGVGSFVVQLAHIHGARVIGVASMRDADFVRDLGADVALDRHAPHLDVDPGTLDLVVDTVGGQAIDVSWPLLSANGRLVSIAPTSRDVGSVDPRGHFFIVTPDRGVLEELARLVVDGKLVVKIERQFPLSETRAAFEFGRQQHPRGKLVLVVRGHS